MSKDKVIVAISMITYNHEKFIKEAIEGVLNQRTNFIFKLIITDDCSQDKTSDICHFYANKYPNIIDFVAFDENKGAVDNWIYNLKKCQNLNAKYIAVCEGDDYWIDPMKLQKQFDFLEQNRSIGLTHTSCKFWDDSRAVFLKTNFINSSETRFNKLFISNTISTCTVMFRSGVINDFELLPYGDISLWLYIAMKSRIKGIPDETAVYRIIENNSASKWNNPRERIGVLENWVKVRTFYYLKYDISLFLILKKYTAHLINMVKMSVNVKKYYPLFKGLVFVKKEIILLINHNK